MLPHLPSTQHLTLTIFSHQLYLTPTVYTLLHTNYSYSHTNPCLPLPSPHPTYSHSSTLQTLPYKPSSTIQAYFLPSSSYLTPTLTHDTLAPVLHPHTAHPSQHCHSTLPHFSIQPKHPTQTLQSSPTLPLHTSTINTSYLKPPYLSPSHPIPNSPILVLGHTSHLCNCTPIHHLIHLTPFSIYPYSIFITPIPTHHHPIPYTAILALSCTSQPIPYHFHLTPAPYTLPRPSHQKSPSYNSHITLNPPNSSKHLHLYLT